MKRPAAPPRALLACLLAWPLASLGQVSPGGPTPAPAGNAGPAVPTTEIRIEASRPAPPAQIDPVEIFGSNFIDHTDAFTADEVLTELTASLPGTQQVVLIDGEETTIDISTIPASRIERIEVSTTGVMPNGKPRVTGNVINIILKKKYNGANFGARTRGSFAGGGGQSQVNASGGYTLGKFSGFANAIHREQDALLASDRDFSQSQNYTALGGSDYRTPYGTAPVVQAVSGPLNGITDANGNPVSIALAPTTMNSALSPADFTAAAAGTLNAAGLRHFNTSNYIYLIVPSSSDVLNGDMTYDATSTTKLHAGYSYTSSSSQQFAAPPVTSVGPGSVVPAAYSPFGQDVEVGFVNSGFGPVRSETTASRRMGYVSADGKVADNWTWEGRFEINSRDSDSQTRDLDPALFAASLLAADPSQRFDPFASDGPGSANAALYPQLAAISSSAGTTDDTRLRANAHGQLSNGWIAPILLSVNLNRNTDDNKQTIDPGVSLGPVVSTRADLTSSRLAANLDIPAFRVRELESPAVLSVSTYETRDQQSATQNTANLAPASLDLKTLAVSGLLNVPWFTPADARRNAYDLQTRIGIGMLRSGGATDLTTSFGVLWSVSKPVTLRADYSREQSPLPYTVYPIAVAYNQTLIDRLRANSIANNVAVVSGQPAVATPPLVRRFFTSAQWVPTKLEKLRLTLSYSDVTQIGQQRVFSAQDILDNEQALANRVTRLPPTADDLAAGEPGEIAQVDVTPFTGGRREDRVVNLLVNDSVTAANFGTLNWRGSVQRVLKSSNELIAGLQVVSTNDQEAPAAWNASTQVDWWRGNWGASSVFRYLGSGTYAGLPYASFGTLDARVSYQFIKPFGGWLGREVRIGAGIQNLFDRSPPFANTITGTRGGSPLGRAYELTVRAVVGD